MVYDNSMMDRSDQISAVTRRGLLQLGLGAALLAPMARARAAQPVLPGLMGLNPQLVDRGLKALSQHEKALRTTSRLVLIDFAMPSVDTRMHLIDLEQGSIRSMRTAHGRGSDPTHSGWLQKFSNVPGSNASSAGSYVTGVEYHGQHGRSLRLGGLDPSNSNAQERAIVIHAAWYVDNDMISRHGKIGRSQGCPAVAPAMLAPLLDFLGEGCLIYADKV